MLGFIFGFIILTSTGVGNINNTIIIDYNSIVSKAVTTPLYVNAPNGAPYLIGEKVKNGLKEYVVITRNMDFEHPILRKGEVVGYPYMPCISKFQETGLKTDTLLKTDMLIELGVSTKTITMPTEIIKDEVIKSTSTKSGIGEGGFSLTELMGIIAVIGGLFLILTKLGVPLWLIILILVVVLGIIVLLIKNKRKET